MSILCLHRIKRVFIYPFCSELLCLKTTLFEFHVQRMKMYQIVVSGNGKSASLVCNLIMSKEKTKLSQMVHNLSRVFAFLFLSIFPK